MALDLRTFLFMPGQEPGELRELVSGLRPADIVWFDVDTTTREEVLAQIVYDDAGTPELLGTSPGDGHAGLAVNIPIWAVFDEPLGAVQSAHVTIYRDGAQVAPSTTAAIGNRLEITGAVPASTSTYQVALRGSLPFASGRTLGLDRVFTFRTG